MINQPHQLKSFCKSKKLMVLISSLTLSNSHRMCRLPIMEREFRDGVLNDATWIIPITFWEDHINQVAEIKNTNVVLQSYYENKLHASINRSITVEQNVTSVDWSAVDLQHFIKRENEGNNKQLTTCWCPGIMSADVQLYPTWCFCSKKVIVIPYEPCVVCEKLSSYYAG